MLNWTVVRHIRECIAESLWAYPKEKTSFCSIRFPSLVKWWITFWAASADGVQHEIRQNCGATIKQMLIYHTYCWLPQSCISGQPFPHICNISVHLAYPDTLKMETLGSSKTLVPVNQTIVWNWGLWLCFPFVSSRKTKSQTICDVRNFRIHCLQNIQCM